MAISPPQANPTSQALSFETLNSIFLKDFFSLNKIQLLALFLISTDVHATTKMKIIDNAINKFSSCIKILINISFEDITKNMSKKDCNLLNMN